MRNPDQTQPDEMIDLTLKRRVMGTIRLFQHIPDRRGHFPNGCEHLREEGERVKIFDRDFLNASALKGASPALEAAAR